MPGGAPERERKRKKQIANISPLHDRPFRRELEEVRRFEDLAAGHEALIDIPADRCPPTPA